MSILKAGRPSSEKRAMTMGDISGADKMGSLQNSEFKVR